MGFGSQPDRQPANSEVYPDGGMKTTYQATDERPYRRPFTEKTETYGIAASDHHSRRHGWPALYRKSSVVDDLAEIIRDGRPRAIYVTHEVNTHPDHGSLFWFVRDAAAAAPFEGPLTTFVLHGAEPKEEPSLRIALTAHELAKKRAPIEIYQAGVSPVHDGPAEEYAKPEERFWEWVGRASERATTSQRPIER
jgi:LmbE family N-acetylglucosaminyl deacetylase